LWGCDNNGLLLFQRDRKERKHYTDDWALGDEEIEGGRLFQLEDKLESDRYAQNFVKEMHGKGNFVQKFSHLPFFFIYLFIMNRKFWGFVQEMHERGFSSYKEMLSPSLSHFFFLIHKDSKFLAFKFFKLATNFRTRYA